ncbi:MAG: hypothetical protein ABJE47_04355 [bacterium]
MRTAALFVACLAAAVPAARAQQAQPATSQKPVGPATTARPRVGYAGTATPPETARVVRRPVYYQNGAVPQGGYITTGAPYVVLSDGSVAVNFGNGYERVLRSCARPRTSNVSPSEQTGRDALGRIQDPPGIAALRPGARGQVGGTMPSQGTGACFKTDAQGRPEIVTR